MIGPNELEGWVQKEISDKLENDFLNTKARCDKGIKAAYKEKKWENFGISRMVCHSEESEKNYLFYSFKETIDEKVKEKLIKSYGDEGWDLKKNFSIDDVGLKFFRE